MTSKSESFNFVVFKYIGFGNFNWGKLILDLAGQDVYFPKHPEKTESCKSSNILRRPQNFAQSSLYWHYIALDKSKVKISRNFVAFSEYLNFM